MTVRYYPGTTDPDLSARANAPTAQAAESMPAVLREQERIAFKDAHRHLELYEVPDAWGRPMFKHSHVEASWFGWIARASHEQASSQAGEYPALVCDYCGALTPDPWHSSGMLHGKMSKHIHSCDACAARGAARAQDTREPLTDEQIQDLLLCGNPTDEEMRLIRIGWDAAAASKEASMARPDYCPVGNEPCQSMCDEPWPTERLERLARRLEREHQRNTP